MPDSVDEMLSTIAKLQENEKNLYLKLTENTQKIAMGSTDVLSRSDIESISQLINELSATRVNVYNSLYLTYQADLKNEQSIKTNKEQQTTVLKMVEEELNRSKLILDEAEEGKNNQLKMVEITEYYNLKNDARRKLMKVSAISALAVAVLHVVHSLAQVELLTNLVYFIYIILFGNLLYHIYDFYSRRNDNYNDYKWWYAPRTEKEVDAISENVNNLVFDISGVNIPDICIGELCCGPGTDWSPNGCVLK